MEKMLENAINILKTINENGYEAYIVGGFTRDYLLGNEGKDIDITTSANIRVIEKLFPHTFIQSEKYQTITVIVDDYKYEVTSYRSEKKYRDHRHPVTKIEKKLIKDLKRRDFTINSICLDKDLKVIDLLNGQNELSNKQIKAIGRPNKRFNEDALRMFRAFRFSAKLDFEIEIKTYKSIKKLANTTKYISKERIKDELSKYLTEPYCLKVLPLLNSSRILKSYNSIDRSFRLMERINEVFTLNELLVLISYYENKEITQSLILTHQERDLVYDSLFIIKMIENKKFSLINLLDKSRESLLIAIKITSLFNSSNYDPDELINLYDSMKIKSSKELNIDGNIVKENFNLKTGPIIKEYLNKALTLVLTTDTINDKDILINKLKEDN